MRLDFGTKFEKACIGGIILLLLIIVIPLGRNFDLLFALHSFNGVKDAQTYYSTVYYIVAAVVALCGLYLGYFYFANRKKFDRLTIFLGYLEEYDRNVQSILNRAVRDQAALTEMRSEINRRWGALSSIMDAGMELLGLEQSHLKKLVHMHSFVEGSELIMHTPFNVLAASQEVYSVLDRYTERVTDARVDCYRRVR